MSMNDKHAFLRHAKHLKQVSIRYDNNLTKLQQRQKQDVAADFDTGKSKGHQPFEEDLHWHSTTLDKTRTCKSMGQLELQVTKFSTT